MKRRAQLLSAALNQMDGISCTTIDGAMYAFPTVNLPGESPLLCHRLSILYHPYH